MLASNSSSEILEWVAEYRLRNEDERRAYEAADADSEVDGMSAQDAEVVRIARERGHI